MTYERRVDRHNPSCLVFMIDQSASMSEHISGEIRISRAAAVADQLNGLIYELIQRCTKSLSEPPRPYFAVSVMGYRTDQNGKSIVGPLLQGALADRPWVWTTNASRPSSTSSASPTASFWSRARPVRERRRRSTPPWCA